MNLKGFKMKVHPISDELRSSILRFFRHLLEECKKLQTNEGVISLEPGEHPGEIVYETIVGPVPRFVLEDDDFVYFESPNHRKPGVEKFIRVKRSDFLECLSATTARPQ